MCIKIQHIHFICKHKNHFHFYHSTYSGYTYLFYFLKNHKKNYFSVYKRVFKFGLNFERFFLEKKFLVKKVASNTFGINSLFVMETIE